MHYATNVVVTDGWHYMSKHNNGFGSIQTADTKVE